MKRSILRFASPVLIVTAVTTVVWVNAGSLTPPAGPVAPTMKSLDQVEARTPIDPSQPGFALPYTISQAGSYYLTANMTAAGATAGIIIAADDVTLNLNGFALTGGSSGSAKGVDVPAARKNLTIC